MSRCAACNKILNSFELTRKSPVTGKYYDLCNHCFSFVASDCETVVRNDLLHEEDVDGEACEECGLPEMQGTGQGQIGE